MPRVTASQRYAGRAAFDLYEQRGYPRVETVAWAQGQANLLSRVSDMIGFFIRRLSQAIGVIVLVTIGVFLLQHLLPGNEARAALGGHPTLPEIRAYDLENGLNQSLPQQYLTYLNHAIRGNLGYSYQLDESVGSLLLMDVPNDLIIVGLGLFIALVVAVPLGLLQALRHNRAFDHVSTTMMFILYSMPSFWLGLLLVVFFSITLHWLPSEVPGNVTGFQLLTHFGDIVLPVLLITLVSIALFSRYMRSSGLDQISQDFVRTARAKGLSTFGIVRLHILRNASLPLLTLMGLSLPTLFTAGLVAEQLFNVQGVGLAFYTAVSQQDYPVELGVTLFVAVATVLGNFAADLGYAVLDPTVRGGR